MKQHAAIPLKAKSPIRRNVAITAELSEFMDAHPEVNWSEVIRRHLMDVKKQMEAKS